MIKVTLKDESILEVEKGKTILEIAKQISEGLARNARAGKVDNQVEDLRYPIAVSYTHLDVYKRQEVSFLLFNMFNK